MKHSLFLFILMLSAMQSYAQADTGKWQPHAPAHYSFIKYEENVIGNQHGIDSVLKKLVKLHATHKGRVSMVHIGDSHIQGDGITSVLRNGCREYFGDAGRGLVFPYQLANSNAPHDVGSSSNATWRYNRLTNTQSPIKTGICGYGIESNKENAWIHLQLKDMDGKQEYFDRMVFFLGNDKAYYNIADSQAILPSVATSRGVDTPSFVVETAAPVTSFRLTRTVFTPEKDYTFYGVSLEHKDSGGVIYHTIGVNGARYDQYVENELFWEQLTALHGDLFIVSMGTNEAQNMQINEPALMAMCDSFVRKIHRIAPKAEVLITTPAGSYYKMRKPNASVEKVSHALTHYCEDKGLAFWDLYKISAGKASAAGWKKNGMLGHDLVHYTPQGYQLQGDLLLNALAKAYNTYAIAHPYKKSPPVKELAAKSSAKQAPAKGAAPQDVKPPKENGAPKKDTVSPAPHTKKLKVDYSR